ncbi:unnamed protein product, partial [Mesorhabditis belari]|uniref:Uncharacterized protein n=1 Tax=Mesorhabditis belari TaxID=2138241 RepID=A0AAF3J349_9BILA
MISKSDSTAKTSIVSVTLEPKKALVETPFSSTNTSKEIILPSRAPTPEITVGVSVVSFPPLPPVPSTTGRQLTFTELPPEEFSLGYGSYKTSTFDPKIYIERLQNRIHQTSYPKISREDERFDEIPIYISNASNVLQFSDEGE